MRIAEKILGAGKDYSTPPMTDIKIYCKASAIETM